MHLKNLNESFDAKYGFDDDIDELPFEDEELEEGVLDLAKGGINKARSAYNNRKADKAYERGDFATGKSVRDRANKLANQSANNFSDHENRRSISDRASAKLANDRELRANNKDAEDEYKAEYQDYIDAARMEFDQCNDVEDLNQAYKIYKDELKNSSKTHIRNDDPVLKELQNLYSQYRQSFGYGTQQTNRNAQINGQQNNQQINQQNRNTNNANYSGFRNAYADDLQKQSNERRNAEYDAIRQNAQAAVNSRPNEAPKETPKETPNKNQGEAPSIKPKKVTSQDSSHNGKNGEDGNYVPKHGKKSTKGLDGQASTSKTGKGLGDYDTNAPNPKQQAQSQLKAQDTQPSQNQPQNQNQQQTPEDEIEKYSLSQNDILGAFSDVINEFTGGATNYPNFQADFFRALDAIMADKQRRRDNKEAQNEVDNQTNKAEAQDGK